MWTFRRITLFKPQAHRPKHVRYGLVLPTANALWELLVFSFGLSFRPTRYYLTTSALDMKKVPKWWYDNYSIGHRRMLRWGERGALLELLFAAA